MEQALKIFFAVLSGMAISGIPLLYKLLSVRLKYKTDSMKVDREQAKMDQDKTINKEEEWKRIIQFRDSEIQRLRDRDEVQDRQLAALYDRFIESQKSEARKDERVKVLEERVNRLTELLVERCPTCPSLNRLMQLPLVSSPASPPVVIVIPPDSHSPPTT